MLLACCAFHNYKACFVVFNHFLLTIFNFIFNTSCTQFVESYIWQLFNNFEEPTGYGKCGVQVFLVKLYLSLLIVTQNKCVRRECQSLDILHRGFYSIIDSACGHELLGKREKAKRKVSENKGKRVCCVTLMLLDAIKWYLICVSSYYKKRQNI